MEIKVLKSSNIVNIGSKLVEELINHNLVVVELGNYQIEDKLWDLQQYLGDYVYHKHSGKFHKDALVAISSDLSIYGDSVRRPQNSSTIQSPHTDGATEPVEPGIMALHCLEPAHIGGESIFCPLQWIVHSLFEVFEDHEIAPLFSEDAAWMTRGDQKVSRPVLYLHKDTDSYRISMTHSAHEFNIVEPSAEAKRPYDFISNFVRKSENRLTWQLQAGQTAFFVNNELLHGRLAWMDSDKSFRHMIRAWYTGNSCLLDQRKRGLPLRYDLGRRIEKLIQ